MYYVNNTLSVGIWKLFNYCTWGFPVQNDPPPTLEYNVSQAVKFLGTTYDLEEDKTFEMECLQCTDGIKASRYYLTEMIW